MPIGSPGGGVNGWPLAFFGPISMTSGGALATANGVTVGGVALPYACTFSSIGFNVGTADTVNNSDVGLYTKAGSLVADIGAQVLGTTGLQRIATVQGLRTIPPGLYLFAFTSAGGILQLFEDNHAWSWFHSFNIASSVGGALPASIGAVPISPDIRLTALSLS